MNRKLAQAAPNSLHPSQFLDVVRNTFKYYILCSKFQIIRIKSIVATKSRDLHTK